MRDRMMHGEASPQTQPWFLTGQGIIAAPDGQEFLAPLNYYSGGEVSQRTKLLLSGKYLTAGEPVWITRRACASLNDRLADRDYFMTITLRTDRSYEAVVNGQTELRPYKFAVKIAIAPMLNMSNEDLANYIYAAFAPERQSQAAAPTVKRGDTRQQVDRALGDPQKVVDLGDKVICVYGPLKVTFRDGRVVDVE